MRKYQKITDNTYIVKAQKIEDMNYYLVVHDMEDEPYIVTQKWFENNFKLINNEQSR